MADLSIPLQGMLRVETAVNAVAGQLARLPEAAPGPAAQAETPQDSVDLSAAMVALAENRVVYAIDAKAVDVLDEMNQSLLNVTG